MEDIFLGDKFREYEEDDWFREGKITEITLSNIFVDFGDYIISYMRGDLIKNWEYYTCQKYFHTLMSGTVVEDFRMNAIMSPNMEVISLAA